MYLDKINQIKQYMADLGWTIEEKIGSEGWSKNKVGYYIKFSRCEWHGKFTVSLTGHDVFFIGLAKNAFDYEEVLNIVHHTAKTARKEGLVAPCHAGDIVRYEKHNKIKGNTKKRYLCYHICRDER